MSGEEAGPAETGTEIFVSAAGVVNITGGKEKREYKLGRTGLDWIKLSNHWNQRNNNIQAPAHACSAWKSLSLYLWFFFPVLLDYFMLLKASINFSSSLHSFAYPAYVTQIIPSQTLSEASLSCSSHFTTAAAAAVHNTQMRTDWHLFGKFIWDDLSIVVTTRRNDRKGCQGPGTCQDAKGRP